MLLSLLPVILLTLLCKPTSTQTLLLMLQNLPPVLLLMRLWLTTLMTMNSV
jgi:hypothetical protein